MQWRFTSHGRGVMRYESAEACRVTPEIRCSLRNLSRVTERTFWWSMESDGMSNMSFLWFKESSRIFTVISKCTQLLYDNATIFIAYIYFDGHLTRYDNVYRVWAVPDQISKEDGRFYRDRNPQKYKMLYQS